MAGFSNNIRVRLKAVTIAEVSEKYFQISHRSKDSAQLNTKNRSLCQKLKIVQLQARTTKTHYHKW